MYTQVCSSPCFSMRTSSCIATVSKPSGTTAPVKMRIGVIEDGSGRKRMTRGSNSRDRQSRARLLSYAAWAKAYPSTAALSCAGMSRGAMTGAAQDSGRLGDIQLAHPPSVDDGLHARLQDGQRFTVRIRSLSWKKQSSASFMLMQKLPVEISDDEVGHADDIIDMKDGQVRLLARDGRRRWPRPAGASRLRGSRDERAVAPDFEFREHLVLESLDHDQIAWPDFRQKLLERHFRLVPKLVHHRPSLW